MVEKLISFSLKKSSCCSARFRLLFGWGIYSVQQNPIDAIPSYQKIRLLFSQVDGKKCR
jgi:Cu(I)/Ag(I) efflux system membrane protein CusA/SilA